MQLWKNSFELQHRKVLMSKQQPQLRENSCQDYPGRSYDVLRCVRATFIALDFFDPHGQKHIRENLPLKHLGFILPLPPTTTTTHYYSP